MVKALADTNLLIDVLCGIPQAVVELSHYDDVAISSITWMEVMSGATPETLTATKALLDGFPVIHLDEAIMKAAATLRARSIENDQKLKLPDAIIMATANHTGRLLVTRDFKDFAAHTNVRNPYVLDTSVNPPRVTSITPALAT